MARLSEFAATFERDTYHKAPSKVLFPPRPLLGDETHTNTP